MALSEAALAAIGAGSAAAVTAAGSVGSAALNNRRAWRNWQKQHEVLLQDWYRQNAYNSPKAQMRRFEAAGLNPNLIYGQQNSADGIDTSAPPSAQEVPLDFGTAINAAQQRYIQLKQLAIQQQNSDALVKLYAAKENQANTSASLNNAMTALRTLQHEGYASTGYYKSQGVLQQKKIEETVNKIKLLVSNTTIADLQGEFLKKTLQNRIAQVALNNRLLRDQHQLNINISRLHGKQASLMDERYIGYRLDNDYKIYTMDDRRNLLKWNVKNAAANYLDTLDAMSIRDLDYFMDNSNFSQRRLFNAIKFGKNVLWLPFPGGSLW